MDSDDEDALAPVPTSNHFDIGDDFRGDATILFVRSCSGTGVPFSSRVPGIATLLNTKRRELVLPVRIETLLFLESLTTTISSELHPASERFPAADESVRIVEVLLASYMLHLDEIYLHYTPQLKAAMQLSTSTAELHRLLSVGDLTGSEPAAPFPRRWQLDSDVSECPDCRVQLGLVGQRIDEITHSVSTKVLVYRSHCRECRRVKCRHCVAYEANSLFATPYREDDTMQSMRCCKGCAAKHGRNSEFHFALALIEDCALPYETMEKLAQLGGVLGEVAAYCSFLVTHPTEAIPAGAVSLQQRLTLQWCEAFLGDVGFTSRLLHAVDWRNEAQGRAGSRALQHFSDVASGLVIHHMTSSLAEVAALGVHVLALLSDAAEELPWVNACRAVSAALISSFLRSERDWSSVAWTIDALFKVATNSSAASPSATTALNLLQREVRCDKVVERVARCVIAPAADDAEVTVRRSAASLVLSSNNDGSTPESTDLGRMSMLLAAFGNLRMDTDDQPKAVLYKALNKLIRLTNGPASTVALETLYGKDRVPDVIPVQETAWFFSSEDTIVDVAFHSEVKLSGVTTGWKLRVTVRRGHVPMVRFVDLVDGISPDEASAHIHCAAVVALCRGVIRHGFPLGPQRLLIESPCPPADDSICVAPSDAYVEGWFREASDDARFNAFSTFVALRALSAVVRQSLPWRHVAWNLAAGKFFTCRPGLLLQGDSQAMDDVTRVARAVARQCFPCDANDVGRCLAMLARPSADIVVDLREVSMQLSLHLAAARGPVTRQHLAAQMRWTAARLHCDCLPVDCRMQVMTQLCETPTESTLLAIIGVCAATAVSLWHKTKHLTVGYLVDHSGTDDALL